MNRTEPYRTEGLANRHTPSSNSGNSMRFHEKLEMCPLEHEWPATYKVEAPLPVGFLEISRYSRHLSRAEPI